MKQIRLFLVLFLSLFLVACGDNDEETTESSVEKETEPVEEESIEIEQEEIDEVEQKEANENMELAESGINLEEIPPVPTTISEVIDYPVGPYAGIDVRNGDDILEAVRKLPPLPKDASDEQLDLYFNYLYSLVAEDFPDPQDTVKKWEFGSFGDPDLPDSRYHFKENYNVEVLLDASGSMANVIDGKTMMDIAKESIQHFLQEVPEEANVSFRVYGHKGTGSESDREKSCAAIEQVYDYAPYDEEAFTSELEQIKPSGWTPLAAAMEQAKDALQSYDAVNSTNLIYVISDGIETCDGDPVAVAKSLADSNAKPIINIIGFNVDSEAQAQLKEMADVSGGIFSTADDQSQLEEEFKLAEEVLKAWDRWKREAMRDANAFRVDNSFDILHLTNKWGQNRTRQFNNLSRLARIFKDEEIITAKQRDIFYGKRNKIDDAIKKYRLEIKEDLKNINAEKVAELKSAIEKKYGEGTED